MYLRKPMTGSRRTESVSRDALIERLRRRLTRHGAPRLQLLLIVGLAGSVAFLVSAVGLYAGLISMTVRYPLAAVCGYLTFLVLIRAWIAWQRGKWDPDVEIDPELLDAVLPQGESSEDFELSQGGRSGGGGASDQWTAGSVDSGSRTAGGGSHVDVDLDDLWPVALAVVCAIGGLAAIFYVVYSAPVLLAEVALDGAVVTTLYRRMRRADTAHWAATTLRRTWISAMVLVVSAAIAGFAFERIAPEARSIGGVIREFRK